jgi:hypothetical protein
MAMLTLDASPAPAFEFRKPISPRTGLHRLFAAAIVSNKFREMLLSEPEQALDNGYLGQKFLLTDREQTILKSIRADTLTDLAQKVNRALRGA